MELPDLKALKIKVKKLKRKSFNINVLFVSEIAVSVSIK